MGEPNKLWIVSLESSDWDAEIFAFMTEPEARTEAKKLEESIRRLPSVLRDEVWVEVSAVPFGDEARKSVLESVEGFAGDVESPITPFKEASKRQSGAAHKPVKVRSHTRRR